MATPWLKREGGNGLHPIPSKTTKFFKIIFNPQDHRLRIPSEFMRRQGKNLPDHVTLKAPGGSSVRKVGLLRSNGETWLRIHKGWKEFKEYYALGFGHFLVFIYDGNSHFDVMIYGMNAMEIEYPHDCTDDGEKGINFNRAKARGVETHDIEPESDDDSVVFLKEVSTNKQQKHKQKNVEILEEHAGTGNQYDKRVRRTVCKETSQAYRRAKSYKFCDPFNISLMQPSYVSDASVLSIPFARKVLPQKHNELKLCNSEGTTWAVKCITRHHDSKLTIGWKGFVYDNVLRVGDVCVFEVNKSDSLVWKVTIFRG